MYQRILWYIINALMRLLMRVEIRGREHIPPKGPCILITNHLSRFDVPLIFIALRPDTPIIVMAAQKYRRNPFIGPLLRSVNAIWIEQNAPDRHALREAIEVLRQGYILGLSPEGTRSTTGGLIRGKPGVAYLASRTGAPILPCALSYTDRIVPTWKRLRRPYVRAEFGPIFHLHFSSPRPKTEELQAETDRMMAKLAAMLPPEHRGVYADTVDSA